MADKYVDHSATNDGDGTAPTQAGAPGGAGAFNTLAGKSFSDGDVVWLRRKDKTYGATWTPATAGVVYVGWPIAGDDYFATRPAAGTAAGWDADGDTYAELSFATSSYYVSVTTTDNQAFHRIRAHQASSSGLTAWYVNSCSPTIKHCVGYNAAPSIASYGFYLNNSSAVLSDCEGEILSTSGSAAGINISGVIGSAKLYDCAGLNANETGAAPGISIKANCLLVRCIGSGQTGPGIYWSATGPSKHLIDCTAQSVSGYGIDARGAALVRNLDLAAGRGYYMENTSDFGGSHHIRRLNQTVAGVAGIWLNGGQVILHVDNATFAAGNTAADIIVTAGSLVVLRNAVFQSSPEILGPCEPGVWSFDHGGTVGAFKAWTKRGVIVSSSAARDGGSASSLQCQANVATTPRQEPLLQVGLDPVTLPSGACTVTVYVAHKSYGTPPTQDDLFFEIDYHDEAGGHRATGTSRDTAAPALDADASTWTGDSGLTITKLTASITTGQACTASLRLFLNAYDAAGYVLVDPRAAVT